MRARMSGGVGGAGVSPAPTRFSLRARHGRSLGRGRPPGVGGGALSRGATVVAFAGKSGPGSGVSYSAEILGSPLGSNIQSRAHAVAGSGSPHTALDLGARGGASPLALSLHTPITSLAQMLVLGQTALRLRENARALETIQGIYGLLIVA
jgi:hypothetical protein